MHKISQVLGITYKDPHHDLVHECKSGSQSAHRQLYGLYSKAMFNTAFKIVNNEAEAADVLQEAFIDAFTRIKDFRQEISFGLWLKQIVIHRAIQQLRKRNINIVPIDDLAIADDDNSYDDEVELQNRVEEVRNAIYNLPDGHRVILSLYLLEGYDHAEIAFILKITESTSRSQLTRAKRSLLALLAGKHKKGEQ